MLDYQKRVIEEKKELDIKIAALSLFLESEDLVEVELKDCILLVQQQSAMLKYSNILGDRIKRFSGAD